MSERLFAQVPASLLVVGQDSRWEEDSQPDGGMAAAVGAAADSDWYVIQVKPRQEGRVVRHLALSALPAFLPFIEVTRRRRSMRTPCLEPLFPGYLFIRLAPLHREPRAWHTVRWTPGVSRILTAGETPVPVPADFVG